MLIYTINYYTTPSVTADLENLPMYTNLAAGAPGVYKSSLMFAFVNLPTPLLPLA